MVIHSPSSLIVHRLNHRRGLATPMSHAPGQLFMFGPHPAPRRPKATLPRLSEEQLRTIADPLDLNTQQLTVVTASLGPSLVLAGAGSGKTKVLTRRAAWLIGQGLHPHQILLITFTRKASAEMLHRVQALNPYPHLKIQGGTFHSMAHTWLRQYGSALELSPRFTLMDEGDTSGMLHLLASKQRLTTLKGFPDKRTLLSLFGHAANNMTSVTNTLEETFPQYSPHTSAIVALHRLFYDTKWTQQRFDYDDLLLLTHRLFMEQTDAAACLSSQYHAILVDEYQDTTRLQAELVRLLGTPHRNVMVVGDDCQSIYSFRSADVRNMQEFTHIFQGTTLYKLEQNYRSSQPILTLANRLLEQAHDTHPKQLFTTRKTGPRPQLVQCPDDHIQSAYVIAQIRALQQQGVGLHRIAVLVRLSAHSYDLETALTHHRLPYVKYGGLALVETAHVKDFLAYLTVTIRPHDRLAWQRLLLLVDRIGPATAEELIRDMKQASDPLSILSNSTAHEDLRRLALLLRELGKDTTPLSLRLQRVLDHYQPYLKRHYPDDMTERMHELAYLVHCHKDIPNLSQLVEALVGTGTSDHTHTPEHPDDTIVISTIHSAKGLEWDAVFLVNAMDGRIPHSRSCSTPQALEEERRLLYVAITRPRHVLTITYPIHTTTYGTGSLGKCCRFLEPIPDTDLDRIMLS